MIITLYSFRSSIFYVVWVEKQKVVTVIWQIPLYIFPTWKTKWMLATHNLYLKITWKGVSKCSTFICNIHVLALELIKETTWPMENKEKRGRMTAHLGVTQSKGNLPGPGSGEWTCDPGKPHFREATPLGPSIWHTDMGNLGKAAAQAHAKTQELQTSQQK